MIFIFELFYSLFEFLNFILCCTVFAGFVILVYYSKRVIDVVTKAGKAAIGAATLASGIDATLNIRDKYRNSNSGSNSGSNSNNKNEDKNKK